MAAMPSEPNSFSPDAVGVAVPPAERGRTDDDARDSRAARAVLAGDRDAYEAVVRRYGRMVHGLMLRCCGDAETAADLTQDAFVRVYEQLGRYDPAKRFFPWFYAVCLNVARDHLRSRRRAPRSEPLPEELPDRSDAPDRRLDGRSAMEALARLPLDYREALLLRYREERSLAEVAQALGIGLSAAKMRVSRGLDMLRDIFRNPRRRRP